MSRDIYKYQQVFWRFLMNQEKRLLSINETAHYLGYNSPTTIWKMIKQGRLTEKHGLTEYLGRKCFDKDILDKSIERKRKNAQT